MKRKRDRLREKLTVITRNQKEKKSGFVVD